MSDAYLPCSGVSSDPDWPDGADAVKGMTELVRQVLRTPYSIGYCSLADAEAWQAPYAWISNADGVFVKPTVSAVQSAVASFADNTDAYGRLHYLSIVDPQNNTAAYPIATLTYFAFNPAVLNCEVLFDVVYLVYWALTSNEERPTCHALTRISTLCALCRQHSSQKGFTSRPSLPCCATRFSKVRFCGVHSVRLVWSWNRPTLLGPRVRFLFDLRQVSRVSSVQTACKLSQLCITCSLGVCHLAKSKPSVLYKVPLLHESPMQQAPVIIACERPHDLRKRDQDLCRLQ